MKNYPACKELSVCEKVHCKKVNNKFIELFTADIFISLNFFRKLNLIPKAVCYRGPFR